MTAERTRRSRSAAASGAAARPARRSWWPRPASEVASAAAPRLAGARCRCTQESWPTHGDPPATRMYFASSAGSRAVTGWSVNPGAGEQHGADPLGAQRRHVGDLLLGVAVGGADHHEQALTGCGPDRAVGQRGEVGVGQVVDDDADDVARPRAASGRPRWCGSPARRRPVRRAPAAPTPPGGCCRSGPARRSRATRLPVLATSSSVTTRPPGKRFRVCQTSTGPHPYMSQAQGQDVEAVRSVGSRALGGWSGVVGVTVSWLWTRLRASPLSAILGPRLGRAGVEVRHRVILRRLSRPAGRPSPSRSWRGRSASVAVRVGVRWPWLWGPWSRRPSVGRGGRPGLLDGGVRLTARASRRTGRARRRWRRPPAHGSSEDIPAGIEPAPPPTSTTAAVAASRSLVRAAHLLGRSCRARRWGFGVSSRSRGSRARAVAIAPERALAALVEREVDDVGSLAEAVASLRKSTVLQHRPGNESARPGHCCKTTRATAPPESGPCYQDRSGSHLLNTRRSARSPVSARHWASRPGRWACPW